MLKLIFISINVDTNFTTIDMADCYECKIKIICYAILCKNDVALFIICHFKCCEKKLLNLLCL